MVCEYSRACFALQSQAAITENNLLMTPSEFVAKWSRNARAERAASQEHFLDVCALLAHPTPNSDATGEDFAFEKGVTRRRATRDGQGWADVWKRDFFGWEYKGKHKDLGAAYEQLKQYREYNARPSWLQNAHRALDAAVCDAYDFPHDLTDDEILARLLALNEERAA